VTAPPADWKIMRTGKEEEKDKNALGYYNSQIGRYRAKIS